MTDPFLAEIRMFAGNFAPRGWALCSGQLMPIQQNTALFSLLGTTYGGDGQSTFALPDLQGATPMQQGQGPGLSPRDLGESLGTQTVTLLTSEMPSHTHTPAAASTNGNSASPANAAAPATFGRVQNINYSSRAADIQMNPQAIGIAGGNQPHNNLPPYLTVTFIIALQGILPQRR